MSLQRNFEFCWLTKYLSILQLTDCLDSFKEGEETPMINTVNTLRPRQNGRHFTDAIFKCIFLNENVWISIKISPKFVPKGLINNISSLVQIMAWRRPGDKPLSEPMIISLPTHICVARPQWVNTMAADDSVCLVELTADLGWAACFQEHRTLWSMPHEPKSSGVLENNTKSLELVQNINYLVLKTKIHQLISQYAKGNTSWLYPKKWPYIPLDDTCITVAFVQNTSYK